MKVWENTSTLDGSEKGLVSTEDKDQTEIIFLVSKPIDIDEFPNLNRLDLQ